MVSKRVTERRVDLRSAVTGVCWPHLAASVFFFAQLYAPQISDEKGKFDELVEEKGVKVLIDPKALMHVIGTKMDYVDDPLKYACYSTT